MTLLAVPNVDYATIMEMAVSHNRDESTFSVRTKLRSLRALLRSVDLRWQLGGAMLTVSTLVSLFGFAGVAHAQGETYDWVSPTQINVSGGRIAPNGKVATWALAPDGKGAFFAKNMKDISGCMMDISITPSNDHNSGVVTVTSHGLSGCLAVTVAQYDKNVGIAFALVSFPPSKDPPTGGQAGCPGSGAGAPPTANYPCPTGGAVVNGVFYPDSTTGRITGKLTWSDGINNGPCNNANITVARIDGTASGDTGVNSGADGSFELRLGAGQVTLATSNCKDAKNDTFSGVSKTLAVPANATIDGSFVANTVTGAASASKQVCDAPTSTSELNFFVCGAISLLSDTVGKMDSALLAAIKLDTDTIFNDSGTARTGNAFFVAWAAFRNIAYLIILAGVLVMVLSQIFGLDVGSALEIRRKLPMLILLVLAMGFLWNAQDFVYNGANASTDVVRDIVAAPFAKVDAGLGNTPGNIGTLAVLIPILLAVGIPAAVAGVALLGVGGVAALLLSLFITVASAYFLIEFRNVGAEMLILVSCPVVAMCLFTQKPFKIWLGLSGAVLISLPGMGFVLQLGEEGAKLAYVNGHIVLAFFILGAVYASFFKLLKWFDKLSGQFGNLAGAITSKATGALNKRAANSFRKRREDVISQKRDIAGTRVAANVMRRVRHADEGGIQSLLPGRLGRNARARYAGVERKHMDHTVNDMLKEDGGHSGGDDDAMELGARRNMDDNTFRREYGDRWLLKQRASDLQARGMDARSAARRAGREMGALGSQGFRNMMGPEAVDSAERRSASALGELRTRFGAELGTLAMRTAAYRSVTASKTSFTDPTGENAQDKWERMIDIGTELMQDGAMTSNDVAIAIKQNKERADRAGVGHGALQAQVEKSFERKQRGAARGVVSSRGEELVTDQEARAFNREALFGAKPHELMGGRHETIEALSGTVYDTLEQTKINVAAGRAAEVAAGVNATNRDALIASARAAGTRPLNAQEAAALQTYQALDQHNDAVVSVMKLLDAAGTSSDQNARVLKERITSQVIAAGGGVDVHPDYITVPHPDAGRVDPVTLAPLGPPPGTTITIRNPRAGQIMTVSEEMEARRNQAGTLEQRREYPTGQAAMAGAAAGPPGGGGGGGSGTSDRRVKRNVIPIGTFKDMQLYRFQYFWSDQTYVGVMAQDLLKSHPEALSKDDYGYYRVDYAALGTQMYTLEEWQTLTVKKPQTVR